VDDNSLNTGITPSTERRKLYSTPHSPYSNSINSEEYFTIVQNKDKSQQAIDNNS